MKQFVNAGLMYAQDYDDTMPGYGTFADGKEQPYIKGYAANWDKPRQGFFCPSDPAVLPQYLTGDRKTQAETQAHHGPGR